MGILSDLETMEHSMGLLELQKTHATLIQWTHKNINDKTYQQENLPTTYLKKCILKKTAMNLIREPLDFENTYEQELTNIWKTKSKTTPK